jgi:hypothetical protein
MADIPVPMTLRVLVQWRKHDRKDHFHVVADKIAEVLIIPEVERSLRNLNGQSEKLVGEELTWKCGLATDLASCLNRGSCTFANSFGSITSKMSSTSFRYMTSLVLLTLGQYRNRPRTTWIG